MNTINHQENTLHKSLEESATTNSCESSQNETMHLFNSENIKFNQPTLNIGTIGHVAHGKTTLVAALTGTRTTRHTSEKIRNMTIYLGYANVKIWKCYMCSVPSCYASSASKVMKKKCKGCGAAMVLERHISLVDCPGHDALVETMLSGAAVMDGALMVIDASQRCPQPQTVEHLSSVSSIGIEKFIIAQNKVDLVGRDGARENYLKIKKFIHYTKAKGAPIVPISAQREMNIETLCHYLCLLPMPTRELYVPPIMMIVRSFDVNKPGIEIEDVIGGVAGGTLVRGMLHVGDTIEIRPGIARRINGEIVCQPILSTITSMKSEQNDLECAVPGGLIGVSTDLDPSITKSNHLVGQIIGYPGSMPPIFKILEITYTIKKTSYTSTTESLLIGEITELCIGSSKIKAEVKAVMGDAAKLVLHLPQCAEVDSVVSISRRYDSTWRLIGWGRITEGSIQCTLME